MERALKVTPEYQTRIVIINGISFQDGGLSKMDEAYKLTKQYEAFLIIDDANDFLALEKK